MKPGPIVEELTQFYWEGAKNDQLLVQKCDECQHLQHPPDIACNRCLSRALTPTPMSGQATLYSFINVDRAFSPAFADETPFVVALVELAERPGLRVITNIVDATADDLTVGMPLELTFEDRDGWRLPQFRPARTEEATR